jgi:hypothetical protein
MYEKPSINKLGGLAELTLAFGDSGEVDTIYDPNGNFFANGSGSVDHIIVPAP